MLPVQLQILLIPHKKNVVSPKAGLELRSDCASCLTADSDSHSTQKTPSFSQPAESAPLIPHNEQLAPSLKQSVDIEINDSTMRNVLTDQRLPNNVKLRCTVNWKQQMPPPTLLILVDANWRTTGKGSVT